MTGNELLKKSNDLLGYKDAAGDEDYENSTVKSAPEYINRVLADLNAITGNMHSKIKELEEDITVSGSAEEDALIYGTCMWIAFGTGDGEKNQYFAHLYNARRTALSRSFQIKNKIPTPEGL